MAAVAHVIDVRRISDTSLFSFLFDTRQGWICQPGVPPSTHALPGNAASDAQQSGPRLSFQAPP
jgi:hypothetical protein